jgi:uncharacterized DUF497 family protein
MPKWDSIELEYDDNTLEHIAKHNVTISQVLYVIKNNKPYITKLKGNIFAIIGQVYGRYLIIIVEFVSSNRIKLKTARDCTEKEKNLYKHKIK